MRKGKKRPIEDKSGGFYLRRRILERKAIRQYLLDKIVEISLYAGGFFGIYRGLTLLGFLN